MSTYNESLSLVEEDKLEGFPRKFKKGLFEGLDKRFATILLISFIVHFLTMLYFVINPPSVEITQEQIARIQRQFANLVLEKEPIETEEIGEEFGLAEGGIGEKGKGAAEEATAEATEKGGKPGEGRAATVEERRVGRAAGAAARQRIREQISREVSSKGILGLLTGSGTAATGEGVEDLLGEAGGAGENLDEVLAGLDGLKREGASTRGKGGAGGRGIKGGRTTTGGDIDELVSGLGSAKSTSFTRTGDLVVARATPLIEKGSTKKGSRDPDAVSAVVNSHNSAIQYCYQRELKRNPDLKGKVVVRFTITPEGTVKNVEIVSSTLNNPRVERCILSRIRRWDDFGVIDPSKGDATFRQVYTFGY